MDLPNNKPILAGELRFSFGLTHRLTLGLRNLADLIFANPC
jgi:hypothetical protein